jgi:hypothetical protein
MSRMDHNPSSRVSFGCPDDVINEFDAICDDEGVSRSERLRALVRQDVDERTDDDDDGVAVVPTDDRLQDAYLALLGIAEEYVHGAGLRVSREEAVNHLYTNNTPKDTVMDSLIRPLKNRGFVNIDPGMKRVWITVRPPE